VFWFVGKVIRIIENAGDDEGTSSTSSTLAGTVYPTITESILSQKRLILEYAKSELRPQNLGGKYANDLELWHAPGDSEMDVVRNKFALERVIGSTRDIRDGFDVNDVGFNPEASDDVYFFFCIVDDVRFIYFLGGGPILLFCV
jgi:hypothetical protein